MDKSPKTAAKKIAIFLFLFLNNLYVKNATIGPTIPIENTFAPNVVKPPWANNRAWNNSTRDAITVIAKGPNKIAPRAVPVACELLPDTEGSFNADRTKQKAAVSAKSIFKSLLLYVLLLIALTPKKKNGADKAK